MNQLPGYAEPKKSMSIRWLLVVALLGAVGFVALRYAPAEFLSNDGNSAHASMEPVRISVANTEDTQQRLDDALANLRGASSDMARSQYWSDRALSTLDDPALTAKRLQMARSASRSAEAQINRAYTEIETISGFLTERKSK